MAIATASIVVDRKQTGDHVRLIESYPDVEGKSQVYQGLELVEQLGSGVPRILESYGRECFRFMDNFIRMVFPVTESVTPQVTPQVERLLTVFKGGHNRQELQNLLGLSDRKNFRENYLNPAIEAGLVRLIDPDNPTSSKQQYTLTEAGKRFTAF